MRTERSRRRLAMWPGCVIVAASLVLAACSGDDDAASTSTDQSATTESTPIETTTRASVAPTTTTSTTVADTTTTTTAATTVPPAPSTTTFEQTDWVAVMNEVYARKFGLLANPDPNRVGEVAYEGNEAYDNLLQQVTDLATNGLHVELDPFSAARVDLADANDHGTGTTLSVRLIVWANPSGGVGSVDASGNVITPFQPPEMPPGTLARDSISLGRRGPDQPWLIQIETSLAPAAP